MQWGDWPNPVTSEKLNNVDLIVVLGGGAMERPRKAAELYRQQVAPTLLVTGDGDIIYNDLLRLGIPARDIIHETSAHSTWDNAFYAGKIFAFQKAHKIALVTTWFHGPRALAVFQKQFPGKSFVVAAEPPIYPLNQWDKAYRCRERYAKIYYGVRYGVLIPPNSYER